jgi:hypothetical protein
MVLMFEQSRVVGGLLLLGLNLRDLSPHYRQLPLDSSQLPLQSSTVG